MRQEYWSTYGHYVYTVYAPKADVKFVILGALLFLSLLQPLSQWNKHQQAVKYLRTASLNGWGLTQGGTKQVQLYAFLQYGVVHWRVVVRL
jgi:hypothetical protein